MERLRGTAGEESDLYCSASVATQRLQNSDASRVVCRYLQRFTRFGENADTRAHRDINAWKAVKASEAVELLRGNGMTFDGTRRLGNSAALNDGTENADGGLGHATAEVHLGRSCVDATIITGIV